MSPGGIYTSPHLAPPGARREQLKITSPDRHGDFLVSQIDAVEVSIHDRITAHEQRAAASFNDFRDEVRVAMAEMRRVAHEENEKLKEELKEESDKVNKRLTAIMGTLIGVFASVTAASVLLALNLVVGK